MRRNMSFSDLEIFFQNEDVVLYSFMEYYIGKKGRIEGGYPPTCINKMNLLAVKYQTQSNFWFDTLEECEDAHDSLLEELSREWPLKTRNNFKRRMTPRGRKRYITTTPEEDKAIEWYNTFSEEEKLTIKKVTYLLDP